MFSAPQTGDSAPESRVAIIVPAFGVAHLLGEALDSLVAQTFPHWECVVIDDGSPDDVATVIAPYLADPRFRFVATANHGVSAARNAAIAASTAAYIALLDGDDRLRPDYLATMLAVLEDDAEARLVTCNARIFGAVRRERPCFTRRQGSGDGTRGTLADVLERSFSVYIGSTFRRADFLAVGGFDPAMAQAEDFDLWVRLLQLGGHARYVNRELGEYRVRAGSASASTTRLLLGDLCVYAKARAALPGNAPEQAVIARAEARVRAALAFEHAIDRVIDGDARGGLAQLRRLRALVRGPVWGASFALWRIVPPLARPMLAWRRMTNQRGATDIGLRQLIAGLAK